MWQRNCMEFVEKTHPFAEFSVKTGKFYNFFTFDHTNHPWGHDSHELPQTNWTLVVQPFSVY